MLLCVCVAIDSRSDAEGGDQQNALLIDSIQPINLYLFYSDEEKKERTAKLLMKWGKKRERMIGANMSSSTHTQYSAFVTAAHDDLLLFILFFYRRKSFFPRIERDSCF